MPLPRLVPDPTGSQLTNVSDDNTVQPPQPSQEELRVAEAEAYFTVQVALAGVVSLYLCRFPTSMSPGLGAPLQVSMLTCVSSKPLSSSMPFPAPFPRSSELVPHRLSIV